jgi:hypothetical protein
MDAQTERNMAFHKAIMDSRRRFIRLVLINPYKTRIKAIKGLVPTFGVGDFGLLKVDLREGSTELEFMPNESKTAMEAKVLDCEFNRKFLASHTVYNYWEIADDKDREEIEQLADEIAARSVRVKKNRKPVEQTLSDSALDEQLAKLQREKLNRDISRKESQRPVVPSLGSDDTDSTGDDLAAIKANDLADGEPDAPEVHKRKENGRSAKRRKPQAKANKPQVKDQAGESPVIV